MERTFFAAENRNPKRLSRYMERVLAMLFEAQMVTDSDGTLAATSYGTLVSRLYLDPFSAEAIRNTISAQETFSDFGLLQLLCSTPDMFTLYARKNDLGMIERFLIEHEEELWVPYEWGDGEEYFRAVKTAMALLDWAEEVGEATICDRYGIGPGDLHGIVEGIGWLLHAAGRLSPMVAPNHKEAVIETDLRVRYGVRHELIPLVQIRGIGRVRARRLFNNGLTGPDALRKAGLERLTSILGAGIAAQVLAQAEGRNVSGSGFKTQKPVQPQVTLGDFGENENE
jgi:helicase